MNANVSRRDRRVNVATDNRAMVAVSLESLELIISNILLMLH